NLARQVEQEARSGRSPFATLARRYSDSLDAAQDGDFGVWSLVDPGYSGPEVEVLGALKVGEVSQPMDSGYGVQILKRIAADERARYAMTALRLKFSPGSPDSVAQNRDDARKLARRLLQKIKKAPGAFDDLQ